jgi:hypothetical protein
VEVHLRGWQIAQLRETVGRLYVVNVMARQDVFWPDPYVPERASVDPTASTKIPRQLAAVGHL